MEIEKNEEISKIASHNEQNRSLLIIIIIINEFYLFCYNFLLDFQIFNVKLNPAEDENFLKSFIVSKQEAYDFDSASVKLDFQSNELKTNILVKNETQPKTINLVKKQKNNDFTHHSANSSKQTKKNVKNYENTQNWPAKWNQNIKTLVSNDVKSVNNSGLIQKFVEKLKEMSSLRKIPLEMTNTHYEILDDLAYFDLSKEKQKKIGFRKNICQNNIYFKRIYKYLKNYWENSFIIHPYQNLKIIFNLLELFLMIFIFFYLPLDIVFEIRYSMSIRFFSSMVMIFDNFLGFRTAYFHHGKLVTDKKKIFKAYLPNFIIDLFIQFSLIYDMFLGEERISVEKRLIKLFIFFQYRKFKQVYNTLIDRFKIDMKFGYYLDFFKLIMTSICVMHWVACIWYAIGAFCNQGNSWLILHEISQKSDFEKYIYSLYWSAVTMMTVGYGDIGPKNIIEVCFAIFVVVIGCGLFAYYIK